MFFKKVLKRLLKLSCIYLMALSIATPLKAKEPSLKLLETFGDWKAYESSERGKKVCYMMSEPKEEKGKYSKRGKAFAIITHRPFEKSFNVVSFDFGYPLKEGEDVLLIVQQKEKVIQKFKLFTHEETAWAIDPKEDQRITDSLTKVGEKIILRGESKRGTKTEDIYSLKGSMAAYKAICQACEVKR